MESSAFAVIAMLAFVYLGYPVLLLAIAAIVGRDRGVAGAVPDRISIIICAHDEADHIAAKLGSVIAALAVWPGSGEIIVADDGSADGTAGIVAGFTDSGVRLIRFARGGKAAALNGVAPLAIGSVLVLTDADPLFEAGTLAALLAPFADPNVGAVAGQVETIRTRARFAAADALFRAYESAIRAAEDRLFGCVSADGGLFAIRATLMPRVPPDVTDDFFISTAAVAAGRRIAFAPHARVFEHSIPGGRQQFRRRVRITVRGLTGLWHRRALMNPLRTGAYGLALLVHKLLRRVALLALPPLWIIAGLLAARGELGWTIFFALFSAVVVLGAAALLIPAALPRPLAMLRGALLHVAALLAGVLLFLAGRRYTQWTQRRGDDPSA